eukprot:2395680-Rhodomonas_salina.4
MRGTDSADGAMPGGRDLLGYEALPPTRILLGHARDNGGLGKWGFENWEFERARVRGAGVTVGGKQSVFTGGGGEGACETGCGCGVQTGGLRRGCRTRGGFWQKAAVQQGRWAVAGLRGVCDVMHVCCLRSFGASRSSAPRPPAGAVLMRSQQDAASARNSRMKRAEGGGAQAENARDC